MLLYVHFPFCRKKCNYCAFFSQKLVPEMVQIYLTSLKNEIVFWSNEFNFPAISSIYFGGGTPSLLSSEILDRIINWINKYFHLAPALEFTLEANPESLDKKEKVSALRKIGVNRISLGIQSLNDEDLNFLGRVHTAKQAHTSFRLLREAGFANISLDFIWGLPGQTLPKWLGMLKKVVKLKPEHISCYALTIEPGTKLAQIKDKLTLPDENEQGKMYVYGGELLESEGYLQYEISNFARIGYSCRHNQGYWDGQDFLGLGPSAVSTIKDKRWQNPANIKDYQKLVEQKYKGLEYEFLDEKKKTNELVMLSLRTSKGLKLKTYRRLTGKNFVQEYATLVNLLHKNHLIRLCNGYLRLTKTGMLVSDTIIERFMEEA
ncbi:radical SAM family heme chaperone HemW [Desulfohalobiaceae bacterium Ax17]|uniref:radical SAM family heme chaperone HemW n=1 Tax=Desulfovulcanus ferrireducens TaxID=2831190 RepID=UPI00207B9C1B|nr:radical SAM family heme chaperone HemW [Desulfovulcanus ferrireducens]MBT8764243.1 radical SAM family heme chaperone HemW [Desulfovulcanus ferrireducens]